jgi:UBX domain-containing protein 1/4
LACGTAEDKKERRRKLGLPEEPTPEELAKEAAAEADKKRRAEEAKQRLPVKPIGGAYCHPLCALDVLQTQSLTALGKVLAYRAFAVHALLVK